jgi:hypothetical protein
VKVATVARENDQPRRAQRVAQGKEILGYRKVSKPNDVDPGTVLTFIYNAQKPGLKNTSLFDSNPEIVFLGLKKSEEGKLYVVGANAHYLERKVDRGKVILRLRTGTRLPSKLFPQMVHAYRLDKIISPVYRAIDVVADASILLSEAVWKSANTP